MNSLFPLKQPFLHEFLEDLREFHSKYPKYYIIACYKLEYITCNPDDGRTESIVSELNHLFFKRYNLTNIIKEITPLAHTYFVLTIKSNQIKFNFTDILKDDKNPYVFNQ